MSENLIELKSIKELLEMNFFIPNYQRGYRWTEQQVKDLLNDIWEFANQKHSDYEFYCLQPLVVKCMNEVERDNNNLASDKNWYEVIDGQQRLTTIFILLVYLKNEKVLDILNLPTSLYNLKYQRDTNTINISKFLSNLQSLNQIDETYIDFFHISNAYFTIKSWFQSPKINRATFCNALLTHESDLGNPKRDKANNVRFIWYESVDEDPIKVFTRLNIGKISLTNAELIKALFLNRTNFKQIEEAHLRLRQQEIASEWDQIEYTLQNEEFWLFLNEKGYTRPTRIDFIFDLMASDKQNELGLSSETLNLIGTDDYRTFRYFYEYFTHGDSDIKKCWEIVKGYFQTFMEWYNDVELYHYVGYLIEYGKKVSDLIEEWQKPTDKATFVKWLKGEIKNVILNKYYSKDKQYTLDSVLDYQYEEDGSNKGKCKPILLFHNIQTIINQNNNSLENEDYQLGVFYKFPFHLYKLESWDVEHINSNTTNPGDDEETILEWLVNVYWGVGKQMQEQIINYNNLVSTEQDELVKKIKADLLTENQWTADEKNRIWNYTLLDSSTNRSYGNAIFSGKRRIIIGKDQGKLIPLPKIIKVDKVNKIDIEKEWKKADSSFVPLCTKQVFMKYYSAALYNPNYWTIEDAEGYRNDIQSCLNQLKETEEEKS